MMAADYSEERLYVLEGRILALQAVIGVFLNEVAPTNDTRRHVRDVISRIMDAVDFSADSPSTPSLRSPSWRRDSSVVLMMCLARSSSLNDGSK